MEKQLKLKSKILRILPKASAVAVAFQNPAFSPGRDHKLRPENATRWLKPHGGKGFSGPIVSMIPDEARRKPNKDGGGNTGFHSQEPTSPKVSCMGQIKHKKEQIKKAKAKKSMSLSKDTRARPVAARSASSIPRDTDGEVIKKHVSSFQRMLLFHGAKQSPKHARRKSDVAAPVSIEQENNKELPPDRAPHVGQMKRFASGRDALANFDWKAQVAPEEMDQDYYSDEDRVESDAEEEDVTIPFSAPIFIGGGGGGGDGSVPNLKPRNEINLWKRRTMAPPRPLQLNPVITAI